MMLTAEDILSASRPGDIFTNDEKVMREEYKILVKQWHPDTHQGDPTTANVSSRINI